MDTEKFDDLLDDSAAERRAIDPKTFRAMVADAAEEADRGAPVPRRRISAGIGAAAALALVIGGGGVALASGLVEWPSGFDDLDGSYAFSLPSGRACEVRMLIEGGTSPDDPGSDDAHTRAIQDSVTTWLHEGALERDLDLDAADAEVARILAEQREASGMTVLIDTDGWLVDAVSTPGRPDADDERAFAVDRAVRAAMTAHLLDEGFPENTWTFTSDGGVKCAAE